ncbi:hypothetical protein Cs7R123_65830 [Catellatospora sp. TT07R-123]|nr:hypothetical protein Cs7R123_65830 [Catellatospora sp. TT07R-123]
MSRRVAALVVAVASAILFVPGPAEAASGGGCKTGSYDLRPCISFTNDGGGTLHADFYALVDHGCRKAVLLMYINGKASTTTGTYEIRSGHYGPIRVSVASAPSYAQSAYTRVNYYDCNWNYITYVNSPTIYYFA